jgi:hypothetical protein
LYLCILTQNIAWLHSRHGQSFYSYLSSYLFERIAAYSHHKWRAIVYWGIHSRQLHMAMKSHWLPPVSYYDSWRPLRLDPESTSHVDIIRSRSFLHGLYQHMNNSTYCGQHASVHVGQRLNCFFAKYIRAMWPLDSCPLWNTWSRNRSTVHSCLTSAKDMSVSLKAEWPLSTIGQSQHIRLDRYLLHTAWTTTWYVAFSEARYGILRSTFRIRWAKIHIGCLMKEKV